MRKLTVFIFILISSAFVFTACWDNKDIEELHIVTGVAIDVNEENNNLIDLTLQITNIHSGTGGGDSGSEDAKPIIIQATARTINNILKQLNRESDKFIFLHHLEVILFSVELAEKGIYEYIDFFLRETQSRLEIPLLLVDGRAEDLLKADLQEDNQSSIFLSNSFESFKRISNELHIRLIDVIKRLVDDYHCPFIPILKLEPIEEDKEAIKDAGFAMISEGKYIGRLEVEDILGLIFVKDTVIGVEQEIVKGEDVVVLKILQLRSKPSLEIKDDKISVNVDVYIKASVNEIMGFADLKPPEQIELFTELLESDTKLRILKTFQITQDKKCDLYGIGEMIYKKNPRQWAKFKENWGDIFQTVEMKPNVTVDMRSTGQITDSIEMEKKRNENR